MAQTIKVSDKSYTFLMKKAKAMNKALGRQITMAELIDGLLFEKRKNGGKQR